MKRLFKLLIALGYDPEKTAYVIENQIGRDDFCWLHILPYGKNEGLVALVNFGKGQVPDYANLEMAFERFRKSLPADLTKPLPEILRVVEADGLTAILQKTIDDGWSLLTELRRRGNIRDRLAGAAGELFGWWFEVAGRSPVLDHRERIFAILNRAIHDKLIEERDAGHLNEKFSEWNRWPAIPSLGFLRPDTIHCGKTGFCMRLGEGFFAEDPLWGDLFGFREAVLDLTASESRHGKEVAGTWLSRKIDAGFLGLGIDAGKVLLLNLAADLERLGDYYVLGNPDIEGKWRLAAKIKESVRSVVDE